MANVIVAFSRQENARNIRNILVKSGFHVVSVCTSGAQILSAAEELDRGGLEEIARFSVTAASLSTQHPGGIPSIPELAQVVARMGEPAPLSL